MLLNLCDFFPPLFLHVLLLRFAFTFALPHDDDIVDVYSRMFTLWKTLADGKWS